MVVFSKSMLLKIAGISVVSAGFFFAGANPVAFAKETITDPELPVKDGLLLWLNADAILVSDGPVAEWPDSSPRKNNAIQKDASKRPELVKNALNGHNIVNFSGKGWHLSFTTPLSTIRTAFWAIRENICDISNKPLLGDSKTHDFHRGAVKEFWNQSYSAPGVKSGVTRINGTKADAFNTFIPTQFSIVSLQASGNCSAGNFSFDRAVTRSWNGSLAELIIYEKALSDEEVKNVESYLDSKYNILAHAKDVPVGEVSKVKCSGGRAGFIERLDAGEKQTIVTYGTSLTSPYQSRWVALMAEDLQKKYPGLPLVINAARGAMASAWGLSNLRERVLQFAPDAVFIEFAINDSYLPYNISIEKCRQNLEQLIDEIIKYRPGCSIILMIMNPPTGDHLAKRPEYAKYYQVYRDVAKKRGLLLVDCEDSWKKIIESEPEKFKKYAPDGIHPNVTGAKDITWPLVEKVIFGNASDNMEKGGGK